jgi:hypothetical protein
MRGPQQHPAAAFVFQGLEMSVFNNDREMLRLISAFQEVKSPATRRAVIMLVEELVQKDELAQKGLPKSRVLQKAG